MRANTRSTVARCDESVGARARNLETAWSFLATLFFVGFWRNSGSRQLDRKLSARSPKRVQEQKMHETTLRRARRAGRIVDRFVRRDRIAVVFRYPRLPRSCARSDRIVVTGDAGSPKRKSGPPYPSPRQAGSSTPTVASGSCRRIRDKRSLRKTSRSEEHTAELQSPMYHAC